MPTTATATAKAHQTKAIGWYAVQRVHISDWLKPRRNRHQTVGIKPPLEASKAKPIKTQKSETTTNTQQEQAAANTRLKQKDVTNELLAEPSTNSKEAKKLEAVVRESHTILAKAHSVFPLQLFPDSVNIDRHKLTIVRRQFFGIEQKVSVPLENVKNIEADLGPFFGSITITSDLFSNNTQKVHSLWRDDAKKIQKLVQGAVVAQSEGIDLNKIEVKQLQKMLTDLGSGHTKSM